MNPIPNIKTRTITDLLRERELAQRVNEAPLVIAPQKGPQSKFCSSSADITFYGGAAGAGKSYGLLLTPLRYLLEVPGFNAVIFRRIGTQITSGGGLWDESLKMYKPLGARERENLRDWTFPPYNNVLQLRHLQLERSRFDWQGAQLGFIGFDELTHFTRKQFFYLFSRNRSVSGVRPFIRATYNAVPPTDPTGGWIHEFVGWYLTPQGYPDPEKAGKVRWFISLNDKLNWFDRRADAVQFASETGIHNPEMAVMSFSFIPGDVFDNKVLTDSDPTYISKLQNLTYIEQERLLRSNHFIVESAGKVYNRDWFRVLPSFKASDYLFKKVVRFWDLAATVQVNPKKGQAATASVKVGWTGKEFIILDVTEDFLSAPEVDEKIVTLARMDGPQCLVRWEQEGGSAGKRDASHLARLLVGFDARGVRPIGDKLTRGKPMSSQAYSGNVSVVKAPWTENFLNHLHEIPDGPRWDIHDGTSGAFNTIIYGDGQKEILRVSDPVRISRW